MIPDKLLRSASVFANRSNLLLHLASREPRWKHVAEIGVAFGGFSKPIIEILNPDFFYAVDKFIIHQLDIIFGSPPSLTLGDKEHLIWYQEQFPTASICPGLSWEVLATFADASLDFAYLDAGHDFESVTKDIRELKRVVKPGGIIMFDDYTNFDTIAWEQFGVLAAVNRYIEEGHQVLGISLHPEGFHNIAVVN